MPRILMGCRLESVVDLRCLDDLEEEMTRPETQRRGNPTTQKGRYISGGFTVIQALGKGASSVVFWSITKANKRF